MGGGYDFLEKGGSSTSGIAVVMRADSLTVSMAGDVGIGGYSGGPVVMMEGVGALLVPCNGRLGEIIRGGSVGRYENVGRGTGVCSIVDIED